VMIGPRTIIITQPLITMALTPRASPSRAIWRRRVDPTRVRIRDQVLPRVRGRGAVGVAPAMMSSTAMLMPAASPREVRVVVTRAPSFLRASLRGSWKGLGGDRGDCSWWSPFEGLHDTAALGPPEVVDRLQEDAP